MQDAHLRAQDEELFGELNETFRVNRELNEPALNFERETSPVSENEVKEELDEIEAPPVEAVPKVKESLIEHPVGHRRKLPEKQKIEASPVRHVDSKSVVKSLNLAVPEMPEGKMAVLAKKMPTFKAPPTSRSRPEKKVVAIRQEPETIAISPVRKAEPSVERHPGSPGTPEFMMKPPVFNITPAEIFDLVKNKSGLKEGLKDGVITQQNDDGQRCCWKVRRIANDISLSLIHI